MAISMQHDGLAIGAQSRTRGWAAEGFVLLAMALTTIAFGTVLYTNIPLDFWLSVVAAMALYGAFLAVHGLVRKAETGRNKKGRLAAERKHEGLSGSKNAVPQGEMPRFPVNAPPNLGSSAQFRTGSEPRAMQLPNSATKERVYQQNATPDLPLPGGQSRSVDGLTSARSIAPEKKAANLPPRGSESSPPRVGDQPAGPSTGVQVAPRAPSHTNSKVEAAPTASVGELKSTDRSASPSDSDVETIQGLIKKLADQVNENEQSPGAASANSGDVPDGQADAGNPTPELVQSDEVTKKAIDALNATARSMQSFEPESAQPAGAYGERAQGSPNPGTTPAENPLERGVASTICCWCSKGATICCIKRGAS